MFSLYQVVGVYYVHSVFLTFRVVLIFRMVILLGSEFNFDLRFWVFSYSVFCHLCVLLLVFIMLHSILSFICQFWLLVVRCFL